MKHASYLSFAIFVTLVVTANAQSPSQTSRHEEGLRQHPLQVYALTNGKVIQRPGQDPVSRTVLVRNSKIEAIGQKVDIPAEAEVIDLEGKFLYPGFIDAYSEVAFEEANQRPPSSYWNDEIRADFDVSGALSKSNLSAAEVRKQGFVAQLIAPKDGILRGRSAIYALGSGAIQQNLLASTSPLVGELTLNRRGGRGSYPNSPMGAVALARQAFYDAIWYLKAKQASDKNPKLLLPERNVALQSLQSFLEGRAPVMIKTSDEQFVVRADDFAKEFGLDLIVVGSGREYRRLVDVVKTKRTIVVPVSFPKAPNVASPEAADSVTLQSLMHWDHAPENLARLAAHDVEILLTTHRLETPNLFLKNLRIAVDRGFSEEDALAAMTTVPAKRLGIADQLGTIEKGKLASFIVTSKLLFDKESKVVETWVNGERFAHDSQGPTDITGDWKIEIRESPDSADETLLLNITGKKPLKGTIRPAETTPKFKDKVEVKSLNFEEGNLSGQFVAKDFGIPGVATLSMAIEEDAETYRGTLRWPNGTVSPVTMGKSDLGSPEDKEEERQKVQSDKDGSKKDESKDKVVPKATYSVQYPLGAFGREKPPIDNGLVALKGATVWTCGPQGIMENATVLIEKGKIKEVGEGLKIPKQAIVIDASAYHITPGLIDCHSHIATDGGINESGQAVTAEVRIGDFIDANDIDIYWQLAGGLTTANVLHGSANPIGGQNQVIKMRWGANFQDLKFQQAPLGIKFALGENVKQSNWGDRYTSRYPQTRMGVEQIFRDEFREAQEYRNSQKAFAKSKNGLPPRRDLELDAIVEILEGKRWVHCHSYRQDEILALLRVLDEFKVTIGSLQHILEGYKVADAMKTHGATGSTFSDWWAYKFEVKDAIPYNGAMMHQQGIVVSFNSDDGELGRRMNQEAAKAIKYGGITPEEALKFVTLNPAIQLRIDQYVGSIEPGKHADLALWTGSPLSNFSVCQQTWIDGRKYFDRQEEHEQRAKFSEMKNVLIQKILDSGTPMMGVGEKTDDPSKLWPRHDEFCHSHDDHHEE